MPKSEAPDWQAIIHSAQNEAAKITLEGITALYEDAVTERGDIGLPTEIHWATLASSSLFACLRNLPEAERKMLVELGGSMHSHLCLPIIDPDGNGALIALDLDPKTMLVMAAQLMGMMLQPGLREGLDEAAAELGFPPIPGGRRRR